MAGITRRLIMREIPLNGSSLKSTVDDEDYDWLMQWEWFALEYKPGKFYAARTAKDGSLILMHDEIFKRIQATSKMKSMPH